MTETTGVSDILRISDDLDVLMGEMNSIGSVVEKNGNSNHNSSDAESQHDYHSTYHVSSGSRDASSGSRKNSKISSGDRTSSDNEDVHMMGASQDCYSQDIDSMRKEENAMDIDSTPPKVRASRRIAGKTNHRDDAVRSRTDRRQKKAREDREDAFQLKRRRSDDTTEDYDTTPYYGKLEKFSSISSVMTAASLTGNSCEPGLTATSSTTTAGGSSAGQDTAHFTSSSSSAEEDGSSGTKISQNMRPDENQSKSCSSTFVRDNFDFVHELLIHNGFLDSDPQLAGTFDCISKRALETNNHFDVWQKLGKKIFDGIMVQDAFGTEISIEDKSSQKVLEKLEKRNTGLSLKAVLNSRDWKLRYARHLKTILEFRLPARLPRDRANENRCGNFLFKRKSGFARWTAIKEVLAPDEVAYTKSTIDKAKLDEIECYIEVTV